MTAANLLIIELLKQIADGIVIYEPFRRTPQELAEFQLTVERLLEMERLRLVRRVYTQQREIAGQSHYDLAMVQGGLTAEGEQLLAKHTQGQQS